MIEVIFDVETKKLFEEIEGRDPGKLELSVASAYRREIDEEGREIKGEMRSFWEKELKELWPWFEEADRIIGFNSIGFDVPVLQPYYEGNLAKLNHFDIMDKVKEALGHRLSLNVIARETLDETKIAVGTDAVKWWKAGDEESLANLKKYCEMDVVVTRNVYDYAKKEGKLKFKDRWNELREMEVDFSYPEPEDEIQMGLF